MYQVYLAIFYYLGKMLKDLEEVEVGQTYQEASMHLLAPHAWLISFLGETKDTDKQLPLPNSKEAATNLLRTISYWISGAKNENLLTRTITLNDRLLLTGLASAFENEFARETQEISIFAVTQKGIYSTRSLIESAQKKFPENLLRLMSENTISDLQEAGRCLAFERPTACAFHICRATEALMLTYYEALTGQVWPHPKRDWYSYNAQLAAQSAPSTITNRLGEIRQDRNAYAHPDITVPLDEASVVYELCTGVMFYMAKEVEKLEAAKVAASNPSTPTSPP
jgi:hypothetical protein